MAGLSIRVRDLNPVLNALRANGVPIVARSGEPVKFASSRADIRSIIFRHLDGYGVEALQAPASGEVPAAGNILGASMGLTVGELQATRAFQANLLGFRLTGKMEFAKIRRCLAVPEKHGFSVEAITRVMSN